ncbi:hypothetical protein K445DRAFT_75207 [Daldinia sp. EC12]|nr:hypothetical protein K445DRAFT_75207 [Daldinia sp. EC12]
MTAARLGQFIPHGGLDQVLIGEPLRSNWDICNAVCEGETAEVRVFSEISVFDPVPIIIPMHTVKDDSADYEAELAIAIGKTCTIGSKSEALGYILGYTAANNVSSKVTQMARSQACCSNEFRRDMVFNYGKLAIFLSQGTTLPAGTVIITGSPAGVSFGREPPAYLHDGDELYCRDMAAY